MEKADEPNDENSVVVPLTAIFSKDEAHRRTELDTQRALDQTGFGKFNYKIVVVAGLICMNVAFGITNVSFILPSAACDFQMNTIDKGHLSTAPIFGMLCGACIWGCIADTKGRRTALLNCLFLQTIAEFIAAIVSNYWAFVGLKFTSGVALSGQLAILYTYLGEFQPTKYRGKMLSLMEIPWVLGVILSPIFAWLIIPLSIELTNSYFSFKSWNLFVVMSAVPPLLVGFCLLRLPETPKYLAEIGRYSALRNVLTAMYRENTGNEPQEYIAKLDAAGIIFFTSTTRGTFNKAKEDTVYQISVMGNLRRFFKTLYSQTGMLLRPPYLRKTIITSLSSYCILSSLYSLMLWFPELFQRFAEYEVKYPGVVTSICIVSRSNPQFVQQQLEMPVQICPDGRELTSFLENIILNITGISNLTTIMECDSTIDSQVYIHTLLLGLSCVPVAIIFPLCIDHLGFRFYLIFSTFSCCAVTISMIFVTTSTQNLILSCLFEALISICATVVFCLNVELFPTHLRVTASVLSALFSRAGALIGNTMFGYLIDDHCYLLISIITAELFVAGLLGLCVPRAGENKTKKEERMKSDVSGVENIGSTNTESWSSSQEIPS